MLLSLHPLVQKDLRGALDYYEREGGTKLADRFFAEAELLVEAIQNDPRSFHPLDDFKRRAHFRSFPYHFIFEVQIAQIRITVLRHHKRNPRYGSRRK